MDDVRQYPQPNDDDYEWNIYTDARYHQGLDGPLPARAREGGTFSLLEQQIQFPRCFGPETGSRGGLLFANVGAGKTGCMLRWLMRYTWLRDMKPGLCLVSSGGVNFTPLKIFLT